MQILCSCVLPKSCAASSLNCKFCVFKSACVHAVSHLTTDITGTLACADKGGSVLAVVACASSNPELLLCAGLANGVLLRTQVDRITGQLSDTRTRFLGTRPPKLFAAAVKGQRSMLSLSSRPWLGYSDMGRYNLTPLSYEALDHASGIGSCLRCSLSLPHSCRHPHPGHTPYWDGVQTAQHWHCCCQWSLSSSRALCDVLVTGTHANRTMITPTCWAQKQTEYNLICDGEGCSYQQGKL